MPQRLPPTPPSQSGPHDPKEAHVEVHLCIPADQHQFLPHRRNAPDWLAPDLPIPRQGDVVYLNARSAWGVQLVVHTWLAPTALRIEVWLEHVQGGVRPSGYALTQ